MSDVLEVSEKLSMAWMVLDHARVGVDSARSSLKRTADRREALIVASLQGGRTGRQAISYADQIIGAELAEATSLLDKSLAELSEARRECNRLKQEYHELLALERKQAQSNPQTAAEINPAALDREQRAASIRRAFNWLRGAA